MPCKMWYHHPSINPSNIRTFVRAGPLYFPVLFVVGSSRPQVISPSTSLMSFFFASSFVCQHTHCMILAQPLLHFNPPRSISAALEWPRRAHGLLSVVA
jgi:hypothetical protein